MARGDNLRGRKHPDSGRKRGVANKLTSSFRVAVLTVFKEVGGTEHLKKWALAHPTEFYKIAARLIPSEVAVSGEVAQHFVALLPQPAADADEWIRQHAPLSGDRNQIN